MENNLTISQACGNEIAYHLSAFRSAAKERKQIVEPVRMLGDARKALVFQVVRQAFEEIGEIEQLKVAWHRFRGSDSYSFRLYRSEKCWVRFYMIGDRCIEQKWSSLSENKLRMRIDSYVTKRIQQLLSNLAFL